MHRDISYFNISRIQEAGISVLSWRDTECIKWSKSVFQKLKLQWNEEMHWVGLKEVTAQFLKLMGAVNARICEGQQAVNSGYIKEKK